MTTPIGSTSKACAPSAIPTLEGPTPIKVCLVGSTRWPREYEVASEAETRAGKIVITVGLFGHKLGIDMDGQLKKDLDILHLHKIMFADEVLVLNRPVVECQDCGHIDHRLTQIECQECRSIRLRRHNRIGESTRREIAFARSRGKPIRFRYECENQDMIECVVHQAVEFRSGAIFHFRRSVWLPHAPAPGVEYAGLKADPAITYEFEHITYDINKQKYLCDMPIIRVDNGDGLAGLVRYFGPDWVHWADTDPEPAALA